MTSNAIKRLRSLLHERSLDAALINSPTNRRYLSGYSAEDHAADESSGVLLISQDSALLFTGGTNTAWAAAEAPEFLVGAWKRPWERFVAELVVERSWRRVGFEDRALVVASRNAIAAASEDVEWVPFGEAVDALRAEKSAAEIEELARAIRLTDEVFAEVARSIQVGDTEAQVGWRIERLTREMTESTVAFPPIVASGPHAARPHHAVTDRAIEAGEPIIIDMGVASNGYAGDLTRTLWIGEPSSRLQEVYNVVYRTQAAALRAIASGVRTSEIDQLARDVISEAGYQEYIVHSLGHGLGLRVHEAPSVSIHSEETLRPGHVVTVEPGIYIPDWGGVRIEDVVVVTENGNRLLTAAEKRGGSGS